MFTVPFAKRRLLDAAWRRSCRFRNQKGAWSLTSKGCWKTDAWRSQGRVFDPTGVLHVSNGISLCVKICCFLLKYEKTSTFSRSLPEASAHLLGHTPSWNSWCPNSLTACYSRLRCSKRQHGAFPLSHGSLGSTSLCRNFRKLDVYSQRGKKKLWAWATDKLECE